jgi:hypothetical protein
MAYARHSGTNDAWPMHTKQPLTFAAGRAIPLEIRDVLDVSDLAELQAFLDDAQVRWTTARAFSMHVRRSLFSAGTEPTSGSRLL